MSQMTIGYGELQPGEGRGQDVARAAPPALRKATFYGGFQGIEVLMRHVSLAKAMVL
jgi:hypothetical protein